MKPINFFTLFISLFILCTFTLSNAQESETRTLSSFNGIAVSSSIDAELIKGSKNEIDISVNGIDIENVTTEIKNGILKVGIKRKKINWSWTKRTKVSAVITYTEELSYLSVSSSADIFSEDKIISDRLDLSASSSGDMKIDIQVDELKASVSSSADIKIRGTAGTAKVSVSSSGDFLGKNLMVGEAVLSASSSADIEIGVKNTIQAHASSGADIIYYGNPSTKDIHKSSAGDVRQKKSE